jgi:hypothetical protein
MQKRNLMHSCILPDGAKAVHILFSPRLLQFEPDHEIHIATFNVSLGDEICSTIHVQPEFNLSNPIDLADYPSTVGHDGETTQLRVANSV